MSFAFETVFSHWDKQVDGTIRSKLQTRAGVLRQLTLVARKRSVSSRAAYLSYELDILLIGPRGLHRLSADAKT